MMSATRPLKIFHINMHHRWGGQPNRILTESKGLSERGHEVWVAGPRDCELCRRAEAAGLKVFDELALLRGLRPVSQWNDYRRLRALFERERFDVVHPHGSQDTWLSVLATRSLDPMPVVVRTRHNTFPIQTHPLNRWLYRRIDWVVTIAPQVDDLVSTRGLFPPGQISAIYSVPDLERFAPRDASPERRAELGIPEGAPVIGMTARLAPEKGHTLFIRAVKRIIDEFPGLRVVLVGEGPSHRDIEAEIAALGMTDNFILTAFRTDVPDIVALFDVFALTPTSGESLGTSILEAFAMGKPVVATQVGGTGESVRTGETGFLVPPGDADKQVAGIADGLRQLLASAALRKQMGEAGREMVLREFSPESLWLKSEQLYQTLRDERRAATT